MPDPTRRPQLPQCVVPNPKGKLLDQIREVMRFHHYSLRTGRTYWQWIRRYLAFHRRPDRTASDKGWRPPRSLGAPELASFLSQLATNGNVAASTQNQVLNALVFLDEQVMQMKLGDAGEFARVQRPARLPEVLTQEQTRRVLAELNAAAPESGRSSSLRGAALSGGKALATVMAIDKPHRRCSGANPPELPLA